MPIFKPSQKIPFLISNGYIFFTESTMGKKIKQIVYIKPRYNWFSITCSKGPAPVPHSQHFWQAFAKPLKFCTLRSLSSCLMPLKMSIIMKRNILICWFQKISHFMGIISWGITGSIFLLPPLARRSSMP